MVSLICFLSCASPFSYFSYYWCLPQTVFLQHSYICKSMCHRCAAFLVSTFTFPPCSPEIFRRPHLGLRRPPCLQIPAYAERFCCLFASCPEEAQAHLFSNNMRAISRPATCALLIFLIICFPEMIDFIPFLIRGFAALKSFCLLVQKLSVYLLLSAAAALGFCFVRHISAVSLVSTS